MQLDIVDFYPSITEELFNKALDFAAETVHIDEQIKSILRNASQSLLYHNESIWNKKTGLFDFTMGAYDGAEITDLVGLYLLHPLTN